MGWRRGITTGQLCSLVHVADGDDTRSSACNLGEQYGGLSSKIGTIFALSKDERRNTTSLDLDVLRCDV